MTVLEERTLSAVMNAASEYKSKDHKRYEIAKEVIAQLAVATNDPDFAADKAVRYADALLKRLDD